MHPGVLAAIISAVGGIAAKAMEKKDTLQLPAAEGMGDLNMTPTSSIAALAAGGGGPTVGDAYGKTPIQEVQQDADKGFITQGSANYSDSRVPPSNVYDRPTPGVSPGAPPPKDKMTVGDAFRLASAGAGATSSMMPKAPPPPGLPGGGAFRQIDPTTLMFLQSLMRGR